MSKYKLILYVTGKSAKSKKAIKNIKTLCKKIEIENYTLEIIDVLENPELAEKARIIATPTLVKELPRPIKRIVGDLSNEVKVLASLDLSPTSNSDTKGIKK